MAFNPPAMPPFGGTAANIQGTDPLAEALVLLMYDDKHLFGFWAVSQATPAGQSPLERHSAAGWARTDPVAPTPGSEQGMSTWTPLIETGKTPLF